jgi:hypothetical protein
LAFPPDRPCGPNPDRLSANIQRLERLLDHNPQARVVWLHAGWDLTGERPVALMRGLLERHANLTMSIKSARGGARPTAAFFPDSDAIRPGWLAMLSAFPDRFMIGSDQFIGDETERLENARRLVDGLCMATRPGALDPGVVIYLFQSSGCRCARSRTFCTASRVCQASRASAATCASCCKAARRQRGWPWTTSSIVR